ncbi:MAG: AAA family ATPase [Sideroxydans sp.]|nr:AAA family ATPase [Sideroxydans sp.]
MFDALWNLIQAQSNNQLFVGGFVLGLMGLLAAWLRKVPGMLWSYFNRVFIVTAVIDSRNDLFSALITWLNDLPFGRTSRFFTVIQENADPDDESSANGLPQLLYSPAPGFHIFWFQGHLMWIEREVNMNLQVVDTLRIHVLFGSRRYLETLLDDVLKRTYSRLANHTLMFTVDNWAESWRKADARPRRDITSVVLDGEIRQRLLEDVRGFFSKRSWYAQMGIPWRRGYLLYGPPGTGKTSMAFALAGELHLNLCWLSLTNPKLNDQTIAMLLQKTPARSLILIEDVDAFFAARQKQDERIAVSFSGLLNALDGVAAQEGRIIFLTTNHREILDPALIRPGRIDVEFKLDLASREQVATMLLRFHPGKEKEIDILTAELPERFFSPAQIQQALLSQPEFEAVSASLRAQSK